MRTALATGRSFLFVPGDRPERFDKAVASGADVVVLDLEDAVAPPAKEAARDHVATWLRRGGQALVRVNGIGTPWSEGDLEMVGRAEAPAMVADVHSVSDVRAALAHVETVVPLVESAEAVLEAAPICRERGVVRLALGHLDLAVRLSVDPANDDALFWARSMLVLAAAASGLPGPVDGVTADLADDRTLRTDLTRARGLGFAGKLCIHPRQVDVVHQLMRPTEHDIRWARAVVAAGTSGVAAVDGRMVDAPVVARARQILAACP